MDEIEKIKQREDVNPQEGERTYGDVEFADTKNKKYPIDTKEHVLAALRYIAQAKNRDKYDEKDLRTIEGRIHAAAHKFGIDIDAKKSVSFNFFTNLTKAYEEDGEHYIEGAASGTTRDADDEKMAVSAIKAMQKSIEDGIVSEDGSLINVPLFDTHQIDGVLAELGEIISAAITDEHELHIKARLYQDNPASMSLVKQVSERGKKYGMSVAGIINKVQKTWDEELQRHIKMFVDVSLEHVAITTRPSWSPSLGTVMAKSMKNYFISNEDASEEEGTIAMKTKDNLPETAKAADTQETKNLVEETNDTQADNAEGKEVEKSKKGSVTKAHYAVMAKKAGHMQSHLMDMASGKSHPADELQHLVGHAKDFSKSMTGLANDDASSLDEEMSENDNPTPFYLSTDKTMNTDEKVSKAEETEGAEEVVETKEEVKTSEEVKPPENEETTTEEKSITEKPDFEALIKSAIEAATKPLLEEIQSVKKELDVVKSAPVGNPKGIVTKTDTTIDTSRVLSKEEEQDTPEARQARIDKAVAENPNLPMSKILEIFYGVDKK